MEMVDSIEMKMYKGGFSMKVKAEGKAIEG